MKVVVRNDWESLTYFYPDGQPFDLSDGTPITIVGETGRAQGRLKRTVRRVTVGDHGGASR